jgi:hypothetical protein
MESYTDFETGKLEEALAEENYAEIQQQIEEAIQKELN